MKTMQNKKSQLRYAITYDNNQVCQHFGKSPAFMLVDMNGDELVKTILLPVLEAGHNKLADLLLTNQVQIVICGGIGNPAIAALADKDITCIRGVSGSIEDVIEKLKTSNLQDDPSHTCNHHHGESEHTCGNHKCH